MGTEKAGEKSGEDRLLLLEKRESSLLEEALIAREVLRFEEWLSRRAGVKRLPGWGRALVEDYIRAKLRDEF